MMFLEHAKAIFVAIDAQNWALLVPFSLLI